VLAERISSELRAATGGDGRLSRHPGGAADVSQEAGQGSADVSASGNRGVWGILEKGTTPHITRAKGRGLLRTPYGPRPFVRVSGVPARRTWSRGVEAGTPDVIRSAETTFKEVFGA
jgi:hypothetical protein